jgi:hypothetical protein
MLMAGKGYGGPPAAREPARRSGLTRVRLVTVKESPPSSNRSVFADGVSRCDFEGDHSRRCPQAPRL